MTETVAGRRTPEVAVMGHPLAVELEPRYNTQLQVQRARPRHPRPWHRQTGLGRVLEVRKAVQMR